MFGGLKVYAVEGDLLLDDLALQEYCRVRAKRQAGVADPDAREGLVAMTDDAGKIIRWRPGMVLTYAVCKASFTSTARYKPRWMRWPRRQGWESLCGVEFHHLHALDTVPDPTGQCLFTVREVPATVALSPWPFSRTIRHRVAR